MAISLSKTVFYYSTNSSDIPQKPGVDGTKLPLTIDIPSISDLDSFDPPSQIIGSNFSGSTSPVIVLSYENDSDTSIDVHFRLTFYSDPLMGQIVYSAFSSFDQKRWYIGGRPVRRLPVTGLTVDDRSGARAYYVPEVLPPDKINEQLTSDIGSGVEEKSLLCGVAYYVRVDAYAESTFHHVGNFVYKVRAQKIRGDIFRNNTDKDNWVCSGQGRTDIRISQTQNHSMFCNLAANALNDFFIIWQDYRKRIVSNSETNNDQTINPVATYGFYSALQDAFATSGQGFPDAIIQYPGTAPFSFASAYLQPLLILDIYQNPVFLVANDNNELVYNEINFVASAITPPVTPVDLLRENVTFNTVISPIMRVFSDDVNGSFAMASDKILAIVNEPLVRFDVVNANGAYAVRLKNDVDQNWSQWINIGLALPVGVTNSGDFNDNDIFDAYFIDLDRFVVPWLLSPGNGVKKVYCQILTYEGVIPYISIDVFANYSQLDYKITLSNTVDYSSIVKYKGYDVVKGGSSNIIYVKLEFTDIEKLRKYLSLASRYTKYNTNVFSYNVIQDGDDDLYNQALAHDITDLEGIYKGSFQIDNSDGILVKDGYATISVNVPNIATLLRTKPVYVDNTDLYNRIGISQFGDNSTDYKSIFPNISSATLYNPVLSNTTYKIIDIEHFKQLYNADDPKFNFGDIKFYIKNAKSLE